MAIFSTDTSVFTRLTKESPDTTFYGDLIGKDLILISFQVRAEVLSAEFVPNRQQRLIELLKASTVLRHSDATDIHYAAASRERKLLRRTQKAGSDASDGDVWVIASALEHDLPLLSHDRQQIALAREVGLPTFTNLPTLRDANPVLG